MNFEWKKSVHLEDYRKEEKIFIDNIRERERDRKKERKRGNRKFVCIHSIANFAEENQPSNWNFKNMKDSKWVNSSCSDSQTDNDIRTVGIMYL